MIKKGKGINCEANERNLITFKYSCQERTLKQKVDFTERKNAN
jgi:hypothetical protein